MLDYYVYILASESNSTIYVGVTNHLVRRVYEHKNNAVSSFTKKYKVHKLVYFEMTHNIQSAIAREKQIKSWSRARKNTLIETINPQWADLYNSIL